MTDALPPLPAEYACALELIDKAHGEDPRITDRADGTPMPYELHYARKMTRWLALRCPDAAPSLQLACRAQHFRRSMTSPENPLFSPPLNTPASKLTSM